MEAPLRAFLDEKRIKKGEPFTHTTKTPSGSYYIGEDDWETFITIYCNSIRKGARPTVTEKPGGYGPLRVDFDFRSTLDTGLTRQYTSDILKSIVKMYQDEIKAAVQPESFDEKLLICIVLEKKKPRVEEGKVKDGFHLHFPNFSCEGWFQDEYLRTKINKLMIDSNIWDKKSFIEPVEKFIDTGMAKKVWLMYGSSKIQGGEPFLVTKVFNSKLEQITLLEVFQEKMKGRKSAVEYYLPRFLSLRGFNSAVPLKADIESRRAAYTGRRPRKNAVPKKRSMEDVLADIKTIKDGEIMSMLSDDRADDFNSWMDIGWTLFNIGQGCDEALELWIEFSKRSSKFVEGGCEDQWAKMEIRDKSIGSLLAVAKIDSPDRFKEWKDTNVKTFLYKSLYEDKPNEWDVAEVFYKLYKDRFVCADAKKDLWFEFKDHRWQQMGNGIALKRLLATEVVDLYWGLKSDIGDQQRNAEESTRMKLEKQAGKCLKIITALKSVVFQNHVIKMLEVRFDDPAFIKKMDENKLLWVCDNGVLDLELGLFREGRPDDYMSFSCNVSYHKYEKTDDEYIELKEYFRKVFVNKPRRSYFKDTACAAMEGGNVNKTFVIGTGGGDNAKTVTYSLLEKTFGDYCIKFPRELLVIGKSNSSGSARPELSRVRGRRLAIAQELAKTETLNIGVLKELTGNDSFFSRGLYEKGTEIKPMFTLFMACLAGDTAISLPGGFSMPLESLKTNNKVLSWSASAKGLIVTDQKNFLNQGIKKCVKLTLEDGRTITCTPDHRFLDASGKYIEAKDIELGKTELKMGVHQPCYDLENENTTYEFFDYDLGTLEGKLKSMAFCRLLGYGLADGSNNVVLYMGHSLDSIQVVNDIEFLTGKRPAISQNISCQQISIPSELVKRFDKLSPSQGRRVLSPMVLPEFIFEEDCPEFLIREVIAGLFGGDGVVPCIQKNAGYDSTSFSSFSLMASKINKHIPSLVKQFQRLADLIKRRFDIDTTVGKPLHYEEGKSSVSLFISRGGLRPFIEKIGVRYCCHKAYRITAILGYLKYKNSIEEQNERIISRTKELVEIYERQNPSYKISQYDITGLTLIKTFESTQKAQHSTGVDHKLILAACQRNDKPRAKPATSKGFSWYFLRDVEPTVEEEPGCKTIKEALEKAIGEEHIIFNREKIVTYTQARHRILKGEKYTSQQFGDVVTFLEKTGLKKFCNRPKVEETDPRINYSVDVNAKSLPTYKLCVIGREDVGEHQVYDLTIKTPYSNFMANGVVSHNCNEPPQVPGHDDATWNRIRILDYESKFVKPQDLHKFPVPSSVQEQFKMKRFKADPSFGRRLPDMAPVLLSMLFDRYKKYKKRGLREPPEVQMATNTYRSTNDVHLQFIEDRIEIVQYPKDTPDKDKVFLRLPDLYSEFTSWYQETHSSYSKEKINKISLMHEFNKRFTNAAKQGRTHGWYGYKIVDDEPDDEKQRKLREMTIAVATAKAASAKTGESVAPKASGKSATKVSKKVEISEDDVKEAVTKAVAKIPAKKINAKVPAKKIVAKKTVKI